MPTYTFRLMFAALVLFLATLATSVQAEYPADPCCEPGTLLQWSYGTSFSGGPQRSEPLVTDRPDFTESSVTVGRSVTQLEMGYTYSYDNEAGTSVRGHSYPEVLLRQGIGWEWLELRLSWNYAEERTRVAGATVASDRGSEDLAVGLKIALTPQEGLLPETALLGELTVPSGSAPFRGNEVLPLLGYLYSWELNDRLSLGGNSVIFMSLDDTTGTDHATFAQSLALGISITDCLGGYVEGYGIMPTGADTTLPEYVLNGGFTYLLSNDLQLDTFAGVGLNDNAADYFVGTGLSVRF